MTSQLHDDDTSAEGHSCSPRSMANAALAEAEAERDANATAEGSGSSSASMSRMHHEDIFGNVEQEMVASVSFVTGEGPSTKGGADIDHKAIERQIEEVWDDVAMTLKDHQKLNESVDGEDDGHSDSVIAAAVEATEILYGTSMDEFVRKGLWAFDQLSTMSRKFAQLTKVSEIQARDIKRLEESQQSNRLAISNLLRNAETSRTMVRDSARAEQIESELGKQIISLRAERDTSNSTCLEVKRKISLLEDEVRRMKTKLNRGSQERVKLEREARAAKYLVMGVHNHDSTDNDFYKRKVAELDDRLQSQQDVINEQRKEMEEMKRQIERSMSQNDLARIRSDEVVPQKKRKSY